MISSPSPARRRPGPPRSAVYSAFPGLRARVDLRPGVRGQPRVPGRPPAARDLLRAVEPALRLGVQRLVRPVVALVLRRRVDHTGDVAARAEDERDVVRQQLRAGVRRLPRHDVVFLGRVDERRHVDAAEVDLLAELGGAARLADLVLQVAVAQVPAEHRAGQVGVVAVPVQQVERGRGLALEVALDDVGPDEVVGPQGGEHLRQLAAFEQPALADRRLPRGQHLRGDEQAELTGLAEVEHGRQQRHAGGRLLAARGQHRRARWPAACRRCRTRACSPCPRG